MKYHAHVFFELHQTPQIEQLRAQLFDALHSDIFIGGVLLKAVGPLPLPMFQMEFDEADLALVTVQLQQMFVGFSVLIHPLLADEYVAHTEYAVWLGDVLKLNLENL